MDGNEWITQWLISVVGCILKATKENGNFGRTIGRRRIGMLAAASALCPTEKRRFPSTFHTLHAFSSAKKTCEPIAKTTANLIEARTVSRVCSADNEQYEMFTSGFTCIQCTCSGVITFCISQFSLKQSYYDR